MERERIELAKLLERIKQGETPGFVREINTKALRAAAETFEEFGTDQDVLKEIKEEIKKNAGI